MSNKLLSINRKAKRSRNANGGFRNVEGLFPVNNVRNRPLLYEFVYSSRISMVAVVMLLSSFLLQGVQTAYADESETLEPDAVEVVVPVEETPVAEVVEDVVLEEEVSEAPTVIEEKDDVVLDSDITIKENAESSSNIPESSEVNVSVVEVVTESDTAQLGDESPEIIDEDSVISDVRENVINENDDSTLELIETETQVSEDVAGSDEVSTSTEEVEGLPLDDVLNNEEELGTSTVDFTATSTTETAEDSGYSDAGVATSSDSSGGGSSSGSSQEETLDILNEEQTASTTTESSTTTEDIVDDNTGIPSSGVESSNSATSGDSGISDPDESGENTEGDVESATSTATEELDKPIVNYTYSTHSNEYVFDKTSCVAVGGGSYHCSKDVNPLLNESEQTFSSRGERGNLEIFIRTEDGVKQITDNYFDDSSPKYDSDSQQLVWQRLIDGRYQIILFDLKTDLETQLTSGSQNNMEPSVTGKYVVWQQWDGDDWEIVFYDDGEIEVLTNNNDQDLAPVIQDEYIVWTTAGADTQLVRVYSLDTGTIQTITDHEGGAIVNPRFVLVYDTKFDNGDVITRGFDPETGLSSSLAATPASEPIDIPPADSTGETRALIQNKSPQREDFSELSIGDLETLDNDLATSTEVSNESLDLPDLVVATTTEDVVSEPLVLTEFDLVITEPETVDSEVAVSEVVSSASTQSLDSDEG
jgi:hypothetical protein